MYTSIECIHTNYILYEYVCGCKIKQTYYVITISHHMIILYNITSNIVLVYSFFVRKYTRIHIYIYIYIHITYVLCRYVSNVMRWYTDIVRFSSASVLQGMIGCLLRNGCAAKVVLKSAVVRFWAGKGAQMSVSQCLGGEDLMLGTPYERYSHADLPND